MRIKATLTAVGEIPHLERNGICMPVLCETEINQRGKVLVTDAHSIPYPVRHGSNFAYALPGGGIYFITETA